METYKCEYIWLDGYTPEVNLRSNTKEVRLDAASTVSSLPLGSFDGSYTSQSLSVRSKNLI